MMEQEHMNKINCIWTYVKYVSYEINIDSNCFVSLDFSQKCENSMNSSLNQTVNPKHLLKYENYKQEKK